MAKPTEPNAQNSELDPMAHPSGAHIERMKKKAEGGDYREILRPSEREDQIAANRDEPAEGGRDEVPNENPQAPHRGTPENR